MRLVFFVIVWLLVPTPLSLLIVVIPLFIALQREAAAASVNPHE